MIAARDAAAMLASGGGQIVDLRPSMDYRDQAIPGSTWSIRPKVASAVKDRSRPLVLVADTAGIAALAALDLAEAGVGDVGLLDGGIAAWKAAGQALAPSPSAPADKDCIDFVFHTLGRNEGNLDAARAYLAWETDLVKQLDAQERASFRL
jgi:rhodanese-related sulfurtransferase